MFKHKITYNGQTLVYFTTNYGTLWTVRTLLSVRAGKYLNNYYMNQYIKPELCVKLDTCSAHGTLCTGLEGFKQLFADKPDESLEKILMDHEIITGDLPCMKDIRFIDKTISQEYRSYKNKSDITVGKIDFESLIDLCDKIRYNDRVLISAFDFCKVIGVYDLKYKQRMAKYIGSLDIAYNRPLKQYCSGVETTRLYVSQRVLWNMVHDPDISNKPISINSLITRGHELNSTVINMVSIEKDLNNKIDYLTTEVNNLENELKKQSEIYEDIITSLEKELRIAKTLC